MRNVLAVVLMAFAVHAADVTVFVTGDERVPNPVNFDAKRQVTGMFAQLGVHVDWRHGESTAGKAPGTSLPIDVNFTGGKPDNFHPGSLAYARPFDKSTHGITVIYDRLHEISAGRTQLEGALLAHVLAHEIAHILMGTNAHTEDGVMKAHWTTRDYDAMRRKPLSFTPEDELLMRERFGVAEAIR